MNQLSVLIGIATVSFCAVAQAEFFVFDTLIVDRSQVMVHLYTTERGGSKIEALALIGSPMADLNYKARCEEAGTVEAINRALPLVAKHLNSANDTNLLTALTEAGLKGCKLIGIGKRVAEPLF